MPTQPSAELKKVTTNTLQKMKAAGEKISMLTAYDFSFAKIFDAAGIDIILVGDSASNVMAGHTTTLPITLDQMIYHAQSVVRARDRSLVVVDLPFGYYQSNSEIALASSIRIMKESGASTIKLEGGAEVVDSVKRIVSAGIPVMGHLGLTPQSIYKFGTYTVRAKHEAEHNRGRIRFDVVSRQAFQDREKKNRAKHGNQGQCHSAPARCAESSAQPERVIPSAP